MAAGPYGATTAFRGADLPPGERLPVFVGKDFLPARRTDPVGLRSCDPQQIHEQLWATRVRGDMATGFWTDAENPNARELLRLLVAQGRVRVVKTGERLRPADVGGLQVKDPAIWAKEAVDHRRRRVRKGWKRCQFCGQDYEMFQQLRHWFVACSRCSDLIGFTRIRKAEWDDQRRLIRPPS